VIMGGRFKRNYVESAFGTPFLSGKNIVQARMSELKHLSISETEGLADMLVERGWILVTCSGTIGRTSFVWDNFEGFAASQHILRIVPNEDLIDPGYLYAFISSEYGYEQVVRFRYGSVIDEINDEQLKKVVVPRIDRRKERKIGDLIRRAYARRAEALRLEDKAQRILMDELTPDKLRNHQHV
jgi:type I restriction enzyme, S subunit